ncbi:MBL fold metallo-hydrolase [Cryptosporangium aurantiacum]|uniref:L-ascorbate metabolism protein UlaG, beta-lactamase superfamily n=1 Tax=Cryptosporangium aurantiacum TaxID=134849 RepID=A0A1M7RM53_9ACTN|nr:MBL fold metallo-hydrolase [Cryptosporangium aurantiacum]SHN47261.1 L-ascorbate metabolism protein UlaG, beta-lactamase superfamily [Cryptosporangium aurantiacum]
MKVTHLGGPTALVEVAGWRILTDPTFDPPGRRYTFGWGTASRKVAGPALPATDLGDIDVVLLSHDHHADNLDDAGRAVLPSAGAVVTTKSGARRLGAENVRGLLPWASTVLEAPGKPSLNVTATPCRHGPPLSRPIVGDVVGFALTWEGGPDGQFWMTGDTVLYPEVRAVPERIDVDTMLLHLGAVQFGITGPLRYSMTGEEGIRLIELAQPRIAVPVHFEGWSHFHEPQDHLRATFDAASDDVRSRVRWLEPGVPTDLA